MNKMKSKTLIIGFWVVIALVGGGLYARQVGFLDIFKAKGEDAKNIARLVAFPDTIGSFKLNTSHINVEEECDDLGTSEDTRVLGLTGKICTQSANAEYRSTNSSNVVFIHMVNVTEGKEAYEQAVRKITRPETFNGFNIVRIEDHELGWFPKEDFEWLVVQEGTLQGDGRSYSYGKATGQNDVVKYLLEKYPPVDALNPTKN
jgi:hypothetical protein